MKTIGVLGGLGPQATMDFEARLHRASQDLIPRFQNRGYPTLITYYHRRPPFVMADLHTPASPLQPDPDLLSAARWLGTKADVLVIPSNTPHLFLSELQQAAGRPILSIIDLALDAVRARGWGKVGVMGFGDPNVVVYTGRLGELGVAYELLDRHFQSGLNAAILAVMEGRDHPDPRGAALKAVASLREQGVDSIILGCTEIPLLLGEEADRDDVVNPAQLLAEAAVRHALDGG